MSTNTTVSLLSQTFDGLLLVHPQLQVLEKTANEIQGLGLAALNVSKELSQALIDVPARERSRFAQNWLVDRLGSFQNGPVLCTCPDLLFDPSFDLDPLALFRQAARIIRLVVMWPGEFSPGVLCYAVPEHHHYRSWHISETMLRQPVLLIQRLLTP